MALDGTVYCKLLNSGWCVRSLLSLQLYTHYYHF